VPDCSCWAFEFKHYRFRFIARRDGDRVRVFSRHGKDWSDKVPAIVEALLALPISSVTLDGESVVCDPAGLSDFERGMGPTRRLARGVSLCL
jgi:bifunctional non-homologous end joining protein LigD